MFQITLCKNDRCSQPVPDSLNPGVKRQYCSARCSSSQSQRNYRARSQGTGSDGTYGTVNGHPYVRRTIAPSVKSADIRYKKHLEHCAAADGGPCAGRLDPYDKKRICLIKAVLSEDWDQLRRAERGIAWEREITTENGFWKGIPPTEFGEVQETTDGLDGFIEVGGGVEMDSNPIPDLWRSL